MIPRTKNLVIVHTPRRQSLSDWQGVKARIEERSSIEVRIANNSVHDPALERWRVTRPSLVFSACTLEKYRPLGGRIRVNRLWSKWAEIDRMRSAGLPVPESVPLMPDLVLSESDWGPFVITKPLFGSRGEGISVVRTREVVARGAELIGRVRKPLIVQRFVEHVDADGRPTEHRVLAMFGVELYATRRRWLAPRLPLERLVDDPDAIVASNNLSVPVERVLSHDVDVIELARRTGEAFPEIPVLGIDIVRETGTGKLYVLDVNTGGGTWHLSSPQHGMLLDPALRKSMYDQFNALDRAADLLIKVVDAEAM